MVASKAEPRKKSRNRKYSEKRVLQLAHQGCSANTIARDLQVAPSTITRYLQSIGISQDTLKSYKQDRADIKALIGYTAETEIMKVINSNSKLIEAMPTTTKNGYLMALNAIVGTRHQEERLERSLSTDNIHVHNDIVGHKRLIRAARDVGDTGQKLKE